MKRLVLGSSLAAALMWCGGSARAQAPDAAQPNETLPRAEAQADPLPAEATLEPTLESPDLPQPTVDSLPPNPRPAETQPAEALERSEESLEDRREELLDDRDELREDREEFSDDREERMERRETRREQTGGDDNRWRYRQHNGRWWYYLPTGNWTVWVDGNWVPYVAGDFSSGGRYYLPRSSNYGYGATYGSDYGYNSGIGIYLDGGYGDYGYRDYGYGRSNRYRSGYRGLNGYGYGRDYDDGYGYRGYGRGGYDGGRVRIDSGGFGFSYGW